jgi:hypothetical protein
MINSEEPGEMFSYFIPIPSFLRGLLLAFAALFLLMFFGIPVGLFGLTGTFEKIGTDPSVFLMPAAMFALLVFWFLFLAFPPGSWLAKLEFGHDRIRFIPKPPLRWIGEPSVEVPLFSLPKEILLCRGSKDKSPYGFRVLLRWANGRDREIKVETVERLSGHQSALLIERIAAATGLSAQLVQRQYLADGAIQEVPWIPAGRSWGLGAIAKLAFVSMPFVAGGVVAYLNLGPLVIAAVGIAIWLSQTLAVFILDRASNRRSKSAMLYWLTTRFTFGATYAATVYLVSFLFRNK